MNSALWAAQLVMATVFAASGTANRRWFESVLFGVAAFVMLGRLL